MEPIPVSHLACLACSENGTTYGVASSSSPSAGLIAVMDVRKGLIAGEVSKQQGLPVETMQTQVIQTALNFDIIHGAVASPNGRYLAISGYDRQEEDQAVLVVVDVYGGQVHSIPPSVSKQRKAHVEAQQASQPPLPPLLKVKDCASHQVDYQLFASRKGLLVRQVAWHPHSEAHLMVLTSDNCLRLYHLNDLTMAEQTFNLKVNSPGATGTYGFGLSAATYAVDATAFAFGPATSWGFFTVYVLASSGALYSLCPVAPFGMHCPVSVLQAAMADAEEAGEKPSSLEDEEGLLQGLGAGDGAASGRAWLTLAFGSGLEAAAGAGIMAMPHFALPHASPALQGPLNTGAPSADVGADRAIALSAMHRLSPVSSAPGAGMQVLTTLTSATIQGVVYVHVLPGLLRAVWSEMPPCTAIARGMGRLSGRGAGAGGGRGGYGYGGSVWGGDGDEEEDVLVSIKIECECVGLDVSVECRGGDVKSEGGEKASSNGAVLLVDVVELGKRLLGQGESVQEQAGGSGSSHGIVSSVSASIGVEDDEEDDEFEDEEDEEDDTEEAGLVIVGSRKGLTSACSNRRSQRRRAPRVSAAGGYPQPVALLPLPAQQQGGVPGAVAHTQGAGTGDLGCGGLVSGAPHAQGCELVVVSAQACWVVQLTWLAVLGEALSETKSEGDSSQLPRLPPPVVYELHNAREHVSNAQHVSNAAASSTGASQAGEELAGQQGGAPLVTSACVFHDLFVGQGVVLLQPQGSPPVRCLRPQALPQSPTPCTVTSTTPDQQPDQQPDREATTSPKDDVVRAMVRAQYADLLAGAKAAAPPPGGYTRGVKRAQKDQQQQAEGATDAEFLHSVIRALRQGPIQYPHRAHQDVRTRAVQLDGEAQNHTAAVSELEDLCVSLAGRQQGLAERCTKALRMHRNLEQRTALLTDMHWSIPRPLSKAEQQLRADLGVADLAAKDTVAKWTALRNRTEHALQTANSSASLAQPTHSSLPAQGSATPAAPSSPFSPWGVPPPSLKQTQEAATKPAAGYVPPTPGSLGALRVHPHHQIHRPLHSPPSLPSNRWGLLPQSQPTTAPFTSAVQQQMSSLQLSRTPGVAGFRGALAGLSVSPPSAAKKGAGGVLPKSQEEHVENRIMQHFQAISSCSAQLQRMEAAMREARASQAERDAREGVDRSRDSSAAPQPSA